MPKPRLKHEYQTLEHDLIETFIAGHHEWRPDLDYPQSWSDLQGGARALLRMFEIKRRPVALDRGDIVHPGERCNGPCCAVSAPTTCAPCDAKVCTDPTHEGYAR